MKMVIYMNKDSLLKLKKDFIILYLARNGIVTFMITTLVFMLDLAKYYQTSLLNTFSYLFFNNIFTLMYFCLVWIFNYLCFELYKIIVDGYVKDKFKVVIKGYQLNVGIYVCLTIILIIIQLIKIPNIFYLDAYLMYLFMILREVKQTIKNRLNESIITDLNH